MSVCKRPPMLQALLISFLAITPAPALAQSASAAWDRSVVCFHDLAVHAEKYQGLVSREAQQRLDAKFSECEKLNELAEEATRQEKLELEQKVKKFSEDLEATIQEAMRRNGDGPWAGGSEHSGDRRALRPPTSAVARSSGGAPTGDGWHPVRRIRRGERCIVTDMQDFIRITGTFPQHAERTMVSCAG